MRIIMLSLLLGGCGDISKELRRLQSNRDEQARQIAELQQTLQAQIDYNISSINSLQFAITQLQLESSSSQANINNLQLSVGSLQASTNSLIVQVATLNGYTHITELVDPCGDGPGFDEILLRTTQGYVVYFEQGSRRMLSLLPDGNYMTTDQQACAFSIVGGVLQ